MKKKAWFRSLGLADERYIEQAHPDRVIRPRRSRVIVSLVAACACVALLACNLWLFIPLNTTPPDVSRYAESPYYGLIQKLNLLTFEKPTYKNNAKKLMVKASSLFGAGMNGETQAPTASPEATYREVTDNQVTGIVEADRIKRSDTHIYYLDEDVLRVFLIDKENTREVGSFTLYGKNSDTLLFRDQWEFYLSQDCKTVTVITEYANAKNREHCVSLIALDVSDPGNIQKKGEFRITGSYMSSRLTGSNILLLTEFVINKQLLDYGNEETFLPQIDAGNGTHSIPAADIVSPESLNSTRYTVVLKLDESTLALKGTAAYLSYSKEAYVSKEQVFLTRTFTDRQEDADGAYTQNTMTEITCLSYAGDSFLQKGSVTVRGSVKDQWSMDEYQGVLRVFTTTCQSIGRIFENSTSGVTSSFLSSIDLNASLYCIDTASLEVVASVIDFAPRGEQVRSARFDRQNAYVCTSLALSDPVFFFDLSDLGNVTCKDTGTIAGFSTSLIDLEGGYLLGIGVGDSFNDLKIEVYEESEDGVRSVDSYELKETTYSTKYRSYYVDREQQLIGLGILRGGYTEYLLLYFDGYALTALANLPLDGDPSVMRAVYIDGYLYAFGTNHFAVERIFG